MSHKLRHLTAVAYAVNGSGLGHLTRVLAILRWMRRLARLSGVHLNAYVLTSSEASGLALEEGFAAFKIPSKTAIREADLPKDDYLRLARQWVWHSLGLIKPELLIVDTFPAGSFGELAYALDVPRARVFIKRAMKEEFARTAGVQHLLPFYDRILIPGEAGSEQTAETAEAARTRHVGPIMLRSREEMRPRDEARRRLGIPVDKLGVWLSAGGGGDPRAQNGIETLAGILRAEPDLHLVIGAGPLYRAAPIRGANITWLTGFNAMEDFAGLDFAISAAGYNSFHELLHAGVPVALFAQEKIADEQSRRVRVAAEAGCALSLKVDGEGRVSEEDLRRVLGELRSPQRRAELSLKAGEFVPTNDAREAAFEALKTVLPFDVLDEAMEFGSERFFNTLARHEVKLEDLGGVRRQLKLVRDLDAEESRDLILRLITNPFVSGTVALDVFRALASRIPQITTEDDAEELLQATLQVVEAAAPLADERALLALLRSLSKEEQNPSPQLASALSQFLRALHAQGDSIGRGQTMLTRHLGESSAAAASLPEALLAVADEITNGLPVEVELRRDALSFEQQDTSYGD